MKSYQGSERPNKEEGAPHHEGAPGTSSSAMNVPAPPGGPKSSPDAGGSSGSAPGSGGPDLSELYRRLAKVFGSGQPPKAQPTHLASSLPDKDGDE